jgi:hypothetical protein
MDRDALKAQICMQLGIRLITVEYDEPIIENHIRSDLKYHSSDNFSDVFADAAQA